MAKQVFGQLAIFEPQMTFAGGGETARVEIAGALDMTPEDVDNIFRQASKL